MPFHMAINMDVNMADDMDADSPCFHGPVSSEKNILMGNFRPNKYFNSARFLNSAIFKIWAIYKIWSIFKMRPIFKIQAIFRNEPIFKI
jgi:hypothetical protein